MGCQYIVPINYVRQSDETYIQKKNFFIKDCKSQLVPEECGLWNFNHCPNDDDYCNPFIDGDKIYFQYFVEDNKYFYATPQIIDNTTGEVIPSSNIVIESGKDKNQQEYMNFIFDTKDVLGFDCIRFRIRAYKCDLNIREGNFGKCYNQYRKDHPEASQAEAIAHCYPLFCDKYDDFWSELFCRVKCNEPTLLLTGSYTKYDCDGNYYGAFTNLKPNTYIPQIRIPANIELNGYTFDETVSNHVRKTVTQKKSYLFRSRKLPPYVVNIVAKVFASQTVNIDGIDYEGAVSLDKNFEDGKMWILKQSLIQICDENNFTCQ